MVAMEATTTPETAVAEGEESKKVPWDLFLYLYLTQIL